MKFFWIENKYNFQNIMKMSGPKLWTVWLVCFPDCNSVVINFTGDKIFPSFLYILKRMLLTFVSAERAESILALPSCSAVSLKRKTNNDAIKECSKQQNCIIKEEHKIERKTRFTFFICLSEWMRPF